jgi:hypothetical protein
MTKHTSLFRRIESDEEKKLSPELAGTPMSDAAMPSIGIKIN